MSKKILLIEPDAEDRKTFTAILRDEGYQVSTAKDGPTGLRIFKTLQPDAIVSNMVLGDMTAVDICEKIRAGEGGTHVALVLISNSKRSQKYVDGISDKYGLMGFLQKPLAADSLIQMLQKMGEAQGSIAKSSAPIFRASDTQDDSSKSPKTGEIIRFNSPYFPGILLEITQAKKTGSLFLKRGSEDKVIYFERGAVIGVESRVKSEQLGKMLVEKGVIEQNDYLKAAALMVEEGIQLGEALVKLGSIEQGVLKDLIRDHQVYKIASCFLWIDATLEFRETAPPPKIKNHGAFSNDEIFSTGRLLLKKVTNLGQVLKPVENEYFVSNDFLKTHKALFQIDESAEMAFNKLRCGYVLNEVIHPSNEEGLVLLYLASAIVPGKPTPEMLMQRIEELKGMSSTQSGQKTGPDVNQNEAVLEALVKENAELKLRTQQHETELSILKNNAQKKAPSAQEKETILRLQKEVEEAKSESLRYRDEILQLRQTMTEAASPAGAVPVASVVLSEEKTEDTLFDQTFSIPDDTPPQGLPPPTQALPVPSEGEGFFDLSGDLDADLSDGLSGLEAASPTSALDSTQVFDPAKRPATPAATAAPADDFELPSLDGLEGLEGLENAQGAASLDHTVVFTPPPIPQIPNQPNPNPALASSQAGATEEHLDADGLPSDFGTLDEDFDVAFGGTAETPGVAPAAEDPSAIIIDDPFAPGNAPAEVSGLDFDPFAPGADSQAQAPTGAPNPASGGPGNGQKTDELDDFFSLTE